MDILMRPRQGGKTYTLVKRLVQEPDSVLITVHPRAPFLRDIIRNVLRELELPANLPRTNRDIDKVLERVFHPTEYAELRKQRRPADHVLVDGLENVLSSLLGRVDVATMDMPAEAGVAYRVHFEDENVVAAWVREDSYREERRRETDEERLAKERSSRIQMDRIHLGLGQHVGQHDAGEDVVRMHLEAELGREQ